MLLDVWGTDETHVPVGTGGTMSFSAPGGRRAERRLAERDLGVWALPTNLCAVGRNGAILRSDGTTWSAMTSPVGTALFGVGSATNDVYAVGVQSLLHYDGTS